MILKRLKVSSLERFWKNVLQIIIRFGFVKLKISETTPKEVSLQQINISTLLYQKSPWERKSRF